MQPRKKIKKPAQSAGFWWGEMDSNHRSRRTTDLQSVPFGRSGISPYFGAGERNRTINLLITNQLLCLIELHQRITQYFGASGRNRTTDTGIFSPLLYLLSYRGIPKTTALNVPKSDTIEKRNNGDREGVRTLDLQRDRLAF